MSKLEEVIPGQTPLTHDDLEGLIPSHITHRSELNEFEAENVAKAAKKYLLSKRAKIDLTESEGIKKLHFELFGDVWTWAGKYRRRETLPVGVAPHHIAAELKKACDDFRYWSDHKTYAPHEAIIRFHHRLIWVHPFTNGNGRLGRMTADILAHRLDLEPLIWGGDSLAEAGLAREAYLRAMREADKGAFDLLLRFAQGTL